LVEDDEMVRNLTLKALNMYGYTDRTIVSHRVLAPGLNFLGKPFSPEGLAGKVREVLEG
jgi:two-component system cell cycle sensor histidine kinase/response regulator CckA